MAGSTNIGWKFLQRVPGQPMQVGDITRMFNTGDSAPPSSFRDLVNPDDSDAIAALIYGREGVANCFDASQARANGKGSLGLEFTFSRHRGSAAKAMREQLGLGVLAERANDKSINRKDLGLADTDCLAKGGPSDLVTMTVVERRGGGMPGSLEDDRSVLAQALINVGEAQISAGAAGSYGYGKAAVAQASRIRSLFVYTCFKPVKARGSSRRLLGVTYWGNHDLGSARFTGWTLFGRDAGQSVSALEDSEADSYAERLGLERRSASHADELGTTFLVVDPAFNASQLKGALELAWWPLLQASRDVTLQVSIVDEDGRRLVPEVDAAHPILGPFVTSFRRAEEVRTEGRDVREADVVAISGKVGVTALEAIDDGTLSRSTVALMRSPLMVVSYDHVESNRVMAGVFVAHEASNNDLRLVEPPEHDKWLRKNVSGLNAPKQSLEKSKLVRLELADAARTLRLPDPPPVYGMSAFTSHFPAVDRRVAKPRPVPNPERRARKQRLVHVNLVHSDGALVERPTRIDLGGGRLQAAGEVRFWLDADRARKLGRSTLEATVTIGAEVAEDGGTPEVWSVEVSQLFKSGESSFTRITADGVSPAKFEGIFRVAQPIHFFVRTTPYQSDWTMTLIFDCTPWDLAGDPSGDLGSGASDQEDR